MYRRPEHCDGLLGAYVLGACTPRELERVERHVASCASCSRQVAKLREASDALLADVELVPAPPRVKERVMAQVRAEAALFDAARGGDGAAEGPPKPAAAEPLRLGPPPMPRPQGRRPGAPPRRTAPRSRFRAMSRAALAAPAAVVACALLVTGVLVASELGESSERPTILAAEVHAALAPRASGALEVAGDRARLRVAGLPEPGAGRAYQVWVRDQRNRLRPADVMLSVDPNGHGETALPANLSDADAVLVTAEPAGGSSAPTGVPVLSVDL